MCLVNERALLGSGILGTVGQSAWRGRLLTAARQEMIQKTLIKI